MRKLILYICILISPFILGRASPVVTSVNAVQIEQNQAEELKLEAIRDVPEAPELIPAPTPTPTIPAEAKEAEVEDTRSWTKSPFVKEITATSRKYELDPQIIYATIMTESEGDQYAFRYEPKLKDASLCLGQILVSTARQLGFSGNPKELYKPSVCIDLIGKYHRMMLDRYGTLTPVQLAIAYNAGSPHKRPVRGHLTRFKKWLWEEA